MTKDSSTGAFVGRPAETPPVAGENDTGSDSGLGVWSDGRGRSQSAPKLSKGAGISWGFCAASGAVRPQGAPAGSEKVTQLESLSTGIGMLMRLSAGSCSATNDPGSD